MRSAPRTLVHTAAAEPNYKPPQVTVEVIEPQSPPPPPYRIPRRDPIPPRQSQIVKPRTHRLSKKKAFVLADKVFKQEAKKNKKHCPRSKRFCKICKVSCNGPKTFYDHLKSRSHQNQVRIKREGEPYCSDCNRTFESFSHLKHHRDGAAHLKVVSSLHSK